MNRDSERTAKQVAADPQPGDIYYTSWGYDQTNVEFFQIVKRTPGTVTVRRIGCQVVDGRVYPLPDYWVRDWHIDGNSGSPSWEKSETQGYSEKVCRLTLKLRKWQTEPGPIGASLTIDDVRHAWPYEGGGKYDTIAAGYPGH